MEDELALPDASPAVDERGALDGRGELLAEFCLLARASNELHSTHLVLVKKVELKILSKV